MAKLTGLHFTVHRLSKRAACCPLCELSVEMISTQSSLSTVKTQKNDSDAASQCLSSGILLLSAIQAVSAVGFLPGHRTPDETQWLASASGAREIDKYTTTIPKTSCRNRLRRQQSNSETESAGRWFTNKGVGLSDSRLCLAPHFPFYVAHDPVNPPHQQQVVGSWVAVASARELKLAVGRLVLIDRL